MFVRQDFQKSEEEKKGNAKVIRYGMVRIHVARVKLKKNEREKTNIKEIDVFHVIDVHLDSFCRIFVVWSFHLFFSVESIPCQLARVGSYPSYAPLSK
jgi:hypothetical protein